MRVEKKAAWPSGLFFIVILTCLLLSTGTIGQSDQQVIPQERLLRVEIPAKSVDETYRIIPLGEKGLLLFYKSIEIGEQGKIKWYFTLYDQDLQSVWSKSIALQETLEFRNFSIDSDTVGLIFSSSEKAKNVKHSMEIIRLATSKGQFSGNSADMPENGEIAGFILRDGKAWIGLNSKNSPAGFMIFDLITGERRSIYLGENIISSFTEMAFDSSGTRLFVTAKASSARTLTEFTLTIFDMSGKLISRSGITSGKPEIELISMRFLALNPEDIIVAGTYGSPKNQKTFSKASLLPEATGFFITSVKNNQVQPLLFYNFLEFRNIGSVIGNKDVQAIKKRSEKKNKEITEYSVDLTLLPHPLRFSGTEIILGAEAFYPQYHTENFTDYDFYGRPFSNTYSVFDGYRYSKFIMAAFDRSGRLLWDNSAEIRNLVSFDLVPKVNQYDFGDNKLLAYRSEGKIASKIIRGNETLEQLDFSPVEMSFPNDKLLSESGSRLVRWYENFFLCYGYQEIKNVALEKNNKRLVFYFSKVRFD